MGYDVHQLVAGRDLWMGGIKIEHELGLLGHSDTIELIATKGYHLVNIDATICAERPKMNPHIPAMQQCMAKVIGTDPDNISIKATTTEKLGFTGRQEGISAYAVALIEK